ncbi:hypothetical protein, partial [Burkholderia sp. SIMBA_052]|uniref:hypothetical protein n=1 Tax=Burkholderia sp. SIMBA_052 TaxID=3085793 RepID=UPI003979C54A
HLLRVCGGEIPPYTARVLGCSALTYRLKYRRRGNAIAAFAEFQMRGAIRSKPDFDVSTPSFVNLKVDPFQSMNRFSRAPLRRRA